MVEQQTGLELGVLIMGKTRVRSEQGVSLIETLVALLILSFVTISTLAMFSQGMRLNAAGVDYSAITNIAKDKSEELLSMGYDNPALDPNLGAPSLGDADYIHFGASVSKDGFTFAVDKNDIDDGDALDFNNNSDAVRFTASYSIDFEL